MTDKTGILLLSHGSRLDDGEEVIKAYKEMYAEEFPDMPVEYGFMEIRKPGIPETIKKLTEENDLEKIIVVPVFVAHGLHTKRDIPGLLGIESDYEGDDHGHHHHHHDHDDHDHHHGQSTEECMKSSRTEFQNTYSSEIRLLFFKFLFYIMFPTTSIDKQ